eukprot:UN32538
MNPLEVNQNLNDLYSEKEKLRFIYNTTVTKLTEEDNDRHYSLALAVKEDSSTSFVAYIYLFNSTRTRIDSVWSLDHLYKVDWRPKVCAFSLAFRGEEVTVWKSVSEKDHSHEFLYFVIESFYLQHGRAKFPQHNRHIDVHRRSEVFTKFWE